MTDLIASHLKHCKSAEFSKVTIQDRGEVLRRLDADLPFGLAEATVDELQDWLAHEGWKPETRKTYYTHIVGFFRWGAERGHTDDPSAGLIRPTVPQALPKPVTDDELRYALAELPRPWDIYIKLAAYAGLRAGEIADLDRTDISESQVLVNRGKGGKSRRVETHPDLWRSVRLLRPGPIALLGSGAVMTPDQMSHRTNYRLRKIGLRATVHCFRHWFGTTLVAQGVNLLVVAELMGHASPNTTKVYALITSEQRRLAVRTLPALAPTSC